MFFTEEIEGFIPRETQMFSLLVKPIQETYRIPLAIPGQNPQLYHWGLRMGLPIGKEFLEALVKDGSYEVYKLLKSNQFSWCRVHMRRMAFFHGRQEFLRREILMKRATGEDLRYAIEGGQLEILKIFKKSPYIRSISISYKAAVSGHVHILKAVHEGVFGPVQVITTEHLMNGIRSGKIEIVKYLIDIGCQPSPDCILLAIELGHLHILRLLCERDCPCPLNSAQWAAHNNHLEILKAIHDESLGIPCTLNASVMTEAATNGNLEMVKLLRFWGCPWNGDITRAAVLHKRVKVFIALRDGSLGAKCPWYPKDCLNGLSEFPEVATLYELGVLDDEHKNRQKKTTPSSAESST